MKSLAWMKDAAWLATWLGVVFMAWGIWFPQLIWFGGGIIFSAWITCLDFYIGREPSPKSTGTTTPNGPALSK